MRWLATILLMTALHYPIFAQRINVDSLKRLLEASRSDTSRALLLSQLSVSWSMVDPDMGLSFGQKALRFSQGIAYRRGEAFAWSAYGWNWSITGNYKLGIEYAYKALRIFEELNDRQEMGYTYIVLNFNFRELGDFEHALYYGYKAKDIFSASAESRNLPIGSYKKINFAVLAETFEEMDQLDSAIFYVNQANAADPGAWNVPVSILASVYSKQGRRDTALLYYKTARKMAYDNRIVKDIIDLDNAIAKLYLTMGRADSSVAYTRRVLTDFAGVAYLKGLLAAASNLANVYLQQNLVDSALKYIGLRDMYKDSLFSRERERQIQSLAFNDQIRQAQLLEAKKNAKREREIAFELTCVALLVLLALFYIPVYRLRQQVRMERMRNQISGDLHDDLGSALGSILILSRTLQEKMANAGPADKPDAGILARISHTAQKTMDAMDDIVWSINPQKDSLEDMFIRMREFAGQLVADGQIQLSFHTDLQEGTRLDMMRRRNFFLIFKEACINAVRHADCRSIRIEVTIRRNLLYCVVQDDGKGFDPQQATTRNGVKNMKRRAAAIKGRLEIGSIAGVGTTILLNCPIKS
jgi:signal transduction histidine kinase